MKKKILVVGVDGMLGNIAYKYLQKSGYTVLATSRKHTSQHLQYNIKKETFSAFSQLVQQYKISTIINCASINEVKNETFEEAITVNALFPNYIARYCTSEQVNVIHISTNGFYSQNWNNDVTDTPSFHSLYGVTKYLWERNNEHTISLRTSIIWHTPWIKAWRNLLDWFLSLSEEQVISWYMQVWWNWVTTLTLVKIIAALLHSPISTWIYNITSQTISKYELLMLFKEVFKRNITIEKDNTVISNQTMRSNGLEKKLHMSIPSIEKQIHELKEWYWL
jgi:dTDP-4-dehydrorhamnose reductase